jgi:PIN domain nuclease of toxin-antitoxin system
LGCAESGSRPNLSLPLQTRLLLDTHILIRWLIDAKKLSREQLRALEAAVRRTEPVAFSAITLLETSVLLTEGKLRLDRPLDHFFGDLEANPVFRVLSLTYEIASDVASLASLRDPALRSTQYRCL